MTAPATRYGTNAGICFHGLSACTDPPETDALTYAVASSNRSSRSIALLRSKRFRLPQVPSVPKFQLFQSSALVPQRKIRKDRELAA